MIICLSGPRASGKSTTAKSLAALLGWRFFSFGDYVREVARERGLDPQDLLTLQNLGIELINQGWEIFCGNLLTFNNFIEADDVIIDGIRHVEAVQTLSRITATKVILVYLEADDETLEQRMKIRNRGEYFGSSLHDVEKQVKNEVKEIADLVISTNILPEPVAALIVEQLREQGLIVIWKN